MKLYKIIFKYAALSIAFLLFVTACNTDQFTGDSVITPSSPTISVAGSGSYTSNEASATKYDYVISVDKAQVADVYVYATVTEGTAVEGVNFSLSASKITIKAGTLSTPFSVQILSTTTPNETLTFKLQIGDERTPNASVTPSMSDFTISNATDDMLVAGLSWDTNVESTIGVEMDPEDVIDMRMLILDASDSSIVAVEDGGSFEEYDGFNDLTDGAYFIATDVYSATGFGDINEPVTLSFTVEFDQLGTISGQVMSFPDFRTNENACSAQRNYLAKVTKSGSNYTLEETPGTTTSLADVSVLVGTYIGTDAYMSGGAGPWASEVVTQMSGDDLTITGLGFGWMLNFWGETVETNNFVTIEVDLVNLTVNIPEQDYIVTDYQGVLYPYTIVGSGIITDACGGGMTIKYDMIQDGFSTAGWAFGAGWSNVELFEAYIVVED